MRPARWRAARLPLRALWSPGAAMDEAGSRPGPIAAGSLVLLVAALGALALPKLLVLLAAALAPSGQPLLDAHLVVLRSGLERYLLADRLLPPLPFVFGALIVAAVAAPVLAGRGVSTGAVVGVLAVGAAPLVVQRLGELALVLVAPGGGLAAGEVVRLPARFNVGVAGVLSVVGVTSTGALSVVAEATNATGLWVVGLWGWGLARLDRDAAAVSRPAPAPRWPFALSGAAYAAGYAVYGTLFPYYLVLVMGAP
jgi:hypothetical protein